MFSKESESHYQALPNADACTAALIGLAHLGAKSTGGPRLRAMPADSEGLTSRELDDLAAWAETLLPRFGEASDAHAFLFQCENLSLALNLGGPQDHPPLYDIVTRFTNAGVRTWADSSIVKTTKVGLNVLSEVSQVYRCDATDEATKKMVRMIMEKGISHTRWSVKRLVTPDA